MSQNRYFSHVFPSPSNLLLGCVKCKGSSVLGFLRKAKNLEEASRGSSSPHAREQGRADEFLMGLFSCTVVFDLNDWNGGKAVIRLRNVVQGVHSPTAPACAIQTDCRSVRFSLAPIFGVGRAMIGVRMMSQFSKKAEAEGA